MYKIDVYKFYEQRMFNTKDDEFLYALDIVVQKREERIDINTYTNNRTVESNAIDSTIRCTSSAESWLSNLVAPAEVVSLPHDTFDAIDSVADL